MLLFTMLLLVTSLLFYGNGVHDVSVMIYPIILLAAGDNVLRMPERGASEPAQPAPAEGSLEARLAQIKAACDGDLAALTQAAKA